MSSYQPLVSSSFISSLNIVPVYRPQSGPFHSDPTATDDMYYDEEAIKDTDHEFIVWSRQMNEHIARLINKVTV